jgi:hypothetical protein
MQWRVVLCGCMFLLSLIATYQVCPVSLKAGLYTYNMGGADVVFRWRSIPRSSPSPLDGGIHFANRRFIL